MYTQRWSKEKEQESESKRMKQKQPGRNRELWTQVRFRYGPGRLKAIRVEKPVQKGDSGKHTDGGLQGDILSLSALGKLYIPHHFTESPI